MMFAYKRCVRSGEAVKKEGQGRHLQENCERCIKGLKCTALTSERNNYQPKHQYVHKTPIKPKPKNVYKKPVQAPARRTASFSNSTASSDTSSQIYDPYEDYDPYDYGHYEINAGSSSKTTSGTKKPKNNGCCSIQ